MGEHTRGVELPQGALPALLGRACEDLVVVGEAQQAHYFGERQVDGKSDSLALTGARSRTDDLNR